MIHETLHHDVEKLTSEDILTKIVKPKLVIQLNHVLEKSEFYRKLSPQVKNKITEESVIDDLREFPFTTKTELLNDQLSNSPFGSNLTVAIRDVQRIHKTSGTTSQPYIVALTRKDINCAVKVGARCFWASGLRPNDIVIHCLNYNMWSGGYTDHQSLEETGATVVPFGVGNSRLLLNTIQLMNITAIHATPSYMSKLEVILENEIGLNPKDMGLRLGLFGGEGGLQNVEFKRRIENVWGLKAMNANYGMSDVLSMFGSECNAEKGLHFMGQDYLFAELINPTTQVVGEIQKGATGELVLTNLEKEAQPLIRFRSGDIIEVLETDTCDCGRTSFRFRIVGRSDDMVVIKGVNFYPESIRDILSEHYESVTGEFQVIVPIKEPVEKVKIQIELNSTKEIDQVKPLEKDIFTSIRDLMNISPDITFTKKGMLPKTHGKTKRLVRV